MTLSRSDILSIPEFQAIRPRMEQEVLAAKQIRRVRVGENMLFLFENHLTMRWQIQEMARVEGILTEEGVAHELSTYNALLPTSDSLSATLLIDHADPDERDEVLHSLQGLEDRVWLELDQCPPAQAVFDAAQFSGERVSSVQFIRFPLSLDQRQALGELSRPASLVIDHPIYTARTALSASTRGALIEDMQANS